MDLKSSSRANENPYQFATNEDRVQPATVENTYDHFQTNEGTQSSDQLTESTSKNGKSRTIAKVAILSSILAVLFGLALCGIILVSKEKVRLDEVKKESTEIKADMQREQREANATWIKKISEMESQMNDMQSTWKNKVSTLEEQVKKLNYLLKETGWYEASNRLYYPISEDTKTYESV